MHSSAQEYLILQMKRIAVVLRPVVQVRLESFCTTLILVTSCWRQNILVSTLMSVESFSMTAIKIKLTSSQWKFLDYRQSLYSNGSVPNIENQNAYSQTPLVIMAEIYLAGILLLIISDFFSHFWYGDFIPVNTSRHCYDACRLLNHQ